MYTVSKGPSKIVAKTRRGKCISNGSPVRKYQTNRQKDLKVSKNRSYLDCYVTDKNVSGKCQIVGQRELTKSAPLSGREATSERNNFAGLSQNFEKFETIKESGRRNNDSNSPEKLSTKAWFVGEFYEPDIINFDVPKPVFQTKKIYTHPKIVEEEVLTPQHEEIIKYINDSWNIIVAHNPYDKAPTNTPACDANNNSTATSLLKPTTGSTQTASSLYCVEPPSPVLSDFKPFDLESWWGRRLFNNITKSL